MIKETITPKVLAGKMNVSYRTAARIVAEWREIMGIKRGYPTVQSLEEYGLFY